MNITIEDINIPAKLIINDLEYEVNITSIKQTKDEYGEYEFDGENEYLIPGTGGYTLTQYITCEITADISEEGDD